jgi:hypothetical protein
MTWSHHDGIICGLYGPLESLQWGGDLTIVRGFHAFPTRNVSETVRPHL